MGNLLSRVTVGWLRSRETISRTVPAGIAPARYTNRPWLPLPVGSIEPAERGQTLLTGRSLTLGLADDPGVDAARVLDRDRRSVCAVVEDDPGPVAIIRHPVRLERDRDVDDRPNPEDPIEVAGVQAIDDV